MRNQSGRRSGARLGARAFLSLGLGALMGVAAIGVEAIAQSHNSAIDVGDPYSAFVATDAPADSSAPGFVPAPGYERPDFETKPNHREEITVFEDPPESTEPESLNSPINVFAGQRQRFDPGIVGGLLGRAKDGALGR